MRIMPGVAVPSRAPAPFGSLARGYFPSRGLPFSVLVHGIALITVLFASVFHTPAPPSDPPKWVLKNSRSRDMVVMYLPAIAPGGRGAQGLESRRKASSPPAPSRAKGLVYPGPQQIISEAPDPTNRYQTLLQPDLKDRPVLKTPLALPNLVLMADAGLVPRLATPLPAATTPDTLPSEEQTAKAFDEKELTTEAVPAAEPKSRTSIDALKLDVPAPLPLPKTRSPQLVIAPAPTQMVPPLADVEEAGQKLAGVEPKSERNTESSAAKPEKGPPPVDLSPVPIGGAEARNLLALSVMPSVNENPVEVPVGEARGLFAISPEPDLAALESAPGSAAGGESRSDIAASQSVSPPTNSTARGPSIVTISFGPTVDANNQGPPGGGGTAPAGGPMVGAGGGTGSGVGSGPGNAPFAGITIVGGAGPAGTAAGTVLLAPTPRPLQTSYGLFVVSTERGGGGLPFFGVFGDQQVYTVFLDMREYEADPAPTWTLEFALAEETTTAAQSATRIGSHQGLVLPFPTVKKRPALPADLVRRHSGRMVVVYALISVEGKMEQMSVKESADPRLNEPVLEALSKWVFRPAVLDGHPVIMKALLGFRL